LRKQVSHRDHCGVEPISHRDVTTVMMLLGNIQADVARICELLEDEYGEEEGREGDA
jgi:hypothetical protein